MKCRNSGFNLIEIMMVVLLVSIGSSMGVLQLRQSIAVLDADRAANVVMQQIRYARQVAVDQRRKVDIAFVGTNGLTVTRQDGGGVTTRLATVSLPSGYIFGLPSGVGDTPEGYGYSQPVSFNLATTGTFLGDGTFVSPGGVVLNGTVFTKGSGNKSCRAVTLTGGSGRLKRYYVQGTTWVAL